MLTFNNIADMPEFNQPKALAIGTFDGVHLGHRYLIEQMKSKGQTTIFTFLNHPLEILSPNTKVPCITPSKLKLELLESSGVDYCLIQPFSKDLAEMTYKVFLEDIYKAFPFDYIYFGDEDTLGKDREGTPEKIHLLGKALNFKAHYLPKLMIDGKRCSSSSIRELLKKGDLQSASKLLGHHYKAYVNPKDPHIDANLIKQGRYILHFKTNSGSATTEVKLFTDGSFKCNFPDEIINKNQILVTITKGNDHHVEI